MIEKSTNRNWKKILLFTGAAYLLICTLVAIFLDPVESKKSQTDNTVSNTSFQVIENRKINKPFFAWMHDSIVISEGTSREDIIKIADQYFRENFIKFQNVNNTVPKQNIKAKISIFYNTSTFDPILNLALLEGGADSDKYSLSIVESLNNFPSKNQLIAYRYRSAAAKEVIKKHPNKDSIERKEISDGIAANLLKVSIEDLSKKVSAVERFYIYSDRERIDFSL
ncbi:MAG: hypothetical protein NE330_21330 [Lentisphaeraceae bacterium]|nr:hypothetical protein [Lentisphaeraceae bacterium]